MPDKPNRITIGVDGQPNADRPAENKEQAIQLAREAERQIYALTQDQMQALAVAAVAVPTSLDLPEIKLDMPRRDDQMHDAFWNAEKIYRENPSIRRTIDTWVDGQAQVFDHTADEDGNEVPKDQLAVYNSFRRICSPSEVPWGRDGVQEQPRISLRGLVEEVLLDGGIFGNCFVWHRWYDREINGRTYQLPYLEPLNPYNVYVDLAAFEVGVLRYYWKRGRMPTEISTRLKQRFNDYVPMGVRTLTRAATGGKEMPLSLDQLTHLTYHKRRYQPYAVPPLLSLFQPTGQQEKLAQLDFAVADGTIGALWLVKVGTDKMQVVNPRILDNAKKIFDDPRRTMFMIVPHWYAVEVIQPNSDALGPEKFHQSNVQISQGLGLNMTGDPEVDTFLMVWMLTGFRDSMIGEHLQWIYEDIAQRNGFSVVPQIRWPIIELQRNVAEDDVKYERGVMSAETYAKRGGLDYALELQRTGRWPLPEPAVVPFSSPELGQGGQEGEAARQRTKTLTTRAKKKPRKPKEQ